MIKYKLNRRPSQSKDNSVRSKAQIKRREREKSSVRSKVEHVFGVVKGLLRYRKTRYKGLRKQSAKLNIMFALANLILADRPHLAAWFSAPWRAWWVTCTNSTACHSFYGNGALIVRCCPNASPITAHKFFDTKITLCLTSRGWNFIALLTLAFMS